MFLLDTNVISELGKVVIGKARPQVVKWCSRAEASDLYLSAVTIQELELGILLLDRRDAPRRWSYAVGSRIKSYRSSKGASSRLTLLSRSAGQGSMFLIRDPSGTR